MKDIVDMSNTPFLEKKKGIKSNKKRKSGISKFFFSHARRIIVQLIDQLFGNIIFYLFLGFINRAIGIFAERPIRGNFVFYAADKRYLRTMIYDWYVPFVRWKPGLGQVMRQNGYWILSFGVASNEEDFYNPNNKKKLEKMLHRAERIAWIIGVKQLTFAGVLPGIFAKYGIKRKIKAVEKRNTVTAVTCAVYITIKKEGLNKDVPIVVLGGSGYIGECVVTSLKRQGYPGKIYPVDIKKSEKTGILPKEIIFKPTIVLNITKKSAIQDYFSQLWQGVVIVNEVFPEPSEEEIIVMEKIGVACYHITGVEAKAYPEMGAVYKGGIPCCASFEPKEGEGKYKVLTKKLTK